MTSWKLFEGTGQPTGRIKDLPPPPSWRSFTREGATRKKRGKTFQARPEEIELVNAALYLRRPLLVTGKPGTGKTSLAYAVAHELELGEVLYWSITTRTTLKDGLYRYDAIGRAQDGRIGERSLDEIGNYIQLGPLGTAFLPSDRPRALLIDEIDKSDIDLPNDLLHLFEEGQFEIDELARISEKAPEVKIRTAYRDLDEWTAENQTATVEGGKVKCHEFPFVIMTSNGERDFPPPFLRRCLRLKMQEPQEAQLKQIVTAHLSEATAAQAEDLIKEFLRKRDSEKERGDLATDQLLNAIYLLTREHTPIGDDRKKLIDHLLKHLSSSEDS